MAAENRSYYFIGIAGTAMGSVAVALKNAGNTVGGSDEKVYPPMSGILADAGIRYHAGFDAAHLEPPPDVAVIGNALSRGNPEVEAALDRNIPYVSLPELIGRTFIGRKNSYVVTGTHGKSTTTSLLAWIFECAGREPGYMVGGVPLDLPASCRLNTSADFIIEGDEYDTAFFDKRSKFLHYRPHTVIVNNIELDHVDIFLNLDDLTRSFRHLLAIVPSSGRVIANADDEHVARLVREHPVTANGIVPAVTYGSGQDTDWKISDVENVPDGMRLALIRGGNRIELQSRLFGDYQQYNIAAAAAAALEGGIGPETVRGAVASFRGMKRRMEVRGEVNGVTVIDDFAHHPTAVAGTIAGARSRYPGRRIVAVLEPRSNSMRRNIFQERLAESLTGADHVIVTGVHNPDKVPPEELLDVQKLVNALSGSECAAHFCDGPDDAVTLLKKELREGDVVLGMSNGGFGGFYDKLLRTLRE